MRGLDLLRYFETPEELEAFRREFAQALKPPKPGEPVTVAQVVLARLMDLKFECATANKGLNVLLPEHQKLYFENSGKEELLAQLIADKQLLDCKGQIDKAIAELRQRDREQGR